MNCRKFALSVIDLARDQMTDHRLRTAVLQHAESCADCAARLAEERALLTSMRLVVADMAAQQAPAPMEATLLAAFHEQAEHRRVASQPVVAARWWSWQFATVAAAVLLLVAMLVTWGNISRQEPKQEVKNLPVQADIPEPQLTLKGNGLTAGIPPPSRPATRRVTTRRPARAALVTPRDEVLPFYSLVGDGLVAPLESGRIVRVEVPAATLISYGVPVTGEAMSEQVEADLLVGQDGLARAIRFLPPSPSTRTQE